MISNTGLNRTRVELKRALRWKSTESEGKFNEFESNQSGIETVITISSAEFPDSFESNQSGIETFPGLIEIVPHFAV